MRDTAGIKLSNHLFNFPNVLISLHVLTFPSHTRTKRQTKMFGSCVALILKAKKVEQTVEKCHKYEKITDVSGLALPL